MSYQNDKRTNNWFYSSVWSTGTRSTSASTSGYDTNYVTAELSSMTLDDDHKQKNKAKARAKQQGEAGTVSS